MKETNYLKIFMIVIAAKAFTDFIGFAGASYMEKYHPGNGFMLNNSKSSKSIETKP
jgi:hypothetical protein